MYKVSLEKKPMSLYYDVPNRNLKNYLNRQREGVSDVYRTTFAKGESLTDVCNAWDETLKQIEAQWPTLYSYEQEMRAKVGPMSVMKPLKERLDSIEDYYKFGSSSGEPVSEEAISRLLMSWSDVRGLQMRSRPKTLERMRLSTNSGNPYFTKRTRVIDKLLPFTIQRVGESDWDLELPEWKGKLTATLGWRGQEGGPKSTDVKQRVLWMFPFAGNVAELQVYQVLIESLQARNYIPAWNGNEFVDAAVTRLFDTKGPDDLVVCTDFTKFDQHFNLALQECAKKILSGLFNGSSEFEDWLVNIYPLKYGIPLCVDWGKFYTGPHGMGSGSGGTNADETLAHKALQHEAALQHGAILNPNSMCLGDDGILTYPGITVEDVVRSYSVHGLEMNTSKQYASTEDCVYLRRWHHRKYRIGGICAGVYSTHRALGHLGMMERYISPKKWGPKAVAMRQLSILNNCEYHPLGEEFIRFCRTKDKYRLGVDIPGFFERIDKVFEESKANDSLYLSYSATFGDPKPPSQWWVVRVLKNMA